MLIWVSLNQIIIAYLNNYMSQPFIGPYKYNFPIIIDVGLKTQLNKKTTKRRLLEQSLSLSVRNISGKVYIAQLNGRSKLLKCLETINVI